MYTPFTCTNARHIHCCRLLCPRRGLRASRIRLWAGPLRRSVGEGAESASKSPAECAVKWALTSSRGHRPSPIGPVDQLVCNRAHPGQHAVQLQRRRLRSHLQWRPRSGVEDGRVSAREQLKGVGILMRQPRLVRPRLSEGDLVLLRLLETRTAGGQLIRHVLVRATSQHRCDEQVVRHRAAEHPGAAASNSLVLLLLERVHVIHVSCALGGWAVGRGLWPIKVGTVAPSKKPSGAHWGRRTSARASSGTWRTGWLRRHRAQVSCLKEAMNRCGKPDGSVTSHLVSPIGPVENVNLSEQRSNPKPPHQIQRVSRRRAAPSTIVLNDAMLTYVSVVQARDHLPAVRQGRVS
eukprot:9503894-Pyramimonas_sp.AAC.2